MNSWTKMRRALGGSDSRHWRIPGLQVLWLRTDHRKRALFACGIGLGIAGPFAALMLAVAPPDDLWWAAALGALFAVVLAVMAFMFKDAVEIIISLEDDGLRRRVKPLFVNVFGWRNTDEFWQFDSIEQCDIVPADQLGGKYSMITAKVPGQTLGIIVPKKVNIKEVATFLAKQNLSVKAIRKIPPEALPGPSVERRGMVTSAIVGSVGILLVLIGSAARLVIYGEGAKRDGAAVAAGLEAAPEGKTVRECLAPGQGGISQARVSSDGRWIWALTKNKQLLVWNDQQAEPIDQLEIPESDVYFPAFTLDGKRLIVAMPFEVHVWQLEPFQFERKFPIDERPEDATLTIDGRHLIVTNMTAVRLYDLETGEAAEKMPITTGAITATTLTTDGKRLIVAQHPRILSVHLDGGKVDELVVYKSPHPSHSRGTLSTDGNWAAMQAEEGTVLYDLTAGQKVSTIAAGPMYVTPFINSDGTKVAAPTPQGVGVWDTKDGKTLVRYTLNNQTRLDLSGDGHYLLGFASRVPKILVWQMPE